MIGIIIIICDNCKACPILLIFILRDLLIMVGLDDCLAMTKDQIVLERIRKVNGYGKAQPGSHKIRALKEPFVKVEDVNRLGALLSRCICI